MDCPRIEIYMDFTPQKKTPAELATLDGAFSGLQPSEMEKAWSELDAFFRSAGYENDKTMRWDYFRWYTDLSWKFIRNQSPEFVIEVAIARLVPLGILLEIDVFKEFLYYCYFKPFDQNTLAGFYSKVKSAFLQSNAYVGTWQGKDVLLKDVVADVQKVNRPNATSLDNAEILGKIKEIFYLKNDPNFERYVVVSPDQAADHLVGFINFFLGVEPGDIWVIVDSFVHPDKYEQMAQQTDEEEATLSTTPSEIASVAVVEELPVAAAVEPLAPLAPPSPIETMSHADIRAMIEARFSQDKDGQFVNIDGVLSLLDSLATEMDDDRIRELYFFDEASGGFKWNDALLT